MLSSNSELTFPSALAWFMGRSHKVTFEPVAQVQVPLRVPIGDWVQVLQSTYIKAKASCYFQLFFFPLSDIVLEVVFIYMSFFLKSMSKVTRRHCSAPRLQP